MTIQIDLPEELANRLKHEANAKAISLDAYVLSALLGQDAPPLVETRDDDPNREARIRAGESIRELRKGKNLGPDNNSRPD